MKNYSRIVKMDKLKHAFAIKSKVVHRTNPKDKQAVLDSKQYQSSGWMFRLWF